MKESSNSSSPYNVHRIHDQEHSEGWQFAATTSLRSSLLSKLSYTSKHEAYTTLKAAAKKGVHQIEVESVRDFAASQRISIVGANGKQFYIISSIKGCSTIFLAESTREDYGCEALVEVVPKGALTLEPLKLPLFGDVANDEVRELADQIVARSRESCEDLSYCLVDRTESAFCIADPRKQIKSAETSFSWCVGPLLAQQKRWIFAVCLMPCTMFLLGYHTAECSGVDQAIYPMWVWLVWLPFAIFHLRLEKIVISYIGIPYIEVCGRFDILGIQVSFATWFGFCLLQSLLFMTSGATNSLFAATASVAYYKCSSSEMEGLWHASRLSNIFRCSPVYLILALWGVTFLQFAHYVVYAAPRGCHADITYEVTSQGRFAYKTLRGSTLLTGATFLMLGEALGISVVQRMSPGHARGKAMEIVERMNAMDNDKVDDLMKLSTRVIQHLLAPYAVAVNRIFVVGLLRNVLQAYIQTSKFALQRALNFSTSPAAVIASIGLSFASCLPIGMFVLNYETFYRRVHPQISYRVKQFANTDWDKHPAAKKDYIRVQQLLARSRRIMWGIRGSYIVFLVCLVGTIAKFVAVFACPHHLWNAFSGCVHIP